MILRSSNIAVSDVDKYFIICITMNTGGDNALILSQNNETTKAIKLEKKLGEGSFGLVFKAHLNGEKIALKVEKKHGHLENEIRMLKRLDHPSIPKILGMGTYSGYRFYITQLYRFNLLQLLKVKQSFFSSQTVACIVWNLIEALEYIHKKGMIYSDIKPDNVMIGFDNKVYLIDYGLSQLRSEVTPGRFVGTGRYASLNIHKGIPAHFTDDLESLGYMTIFLLTRNLPWIDADNKSMIMAAKEDIKINELCKGLEFNWHLFIGEIISYRNTKKIRYKYLKELMEELVEEKAPASSSCRISRQFLCCKLNHSEEMR